MTSRQFTRILLPLAVTATVSGCSFFGSEDDLPQAPTLSELAPVALPTKTQPLPKVTLENVVMNYKKVLEVTKDDSVRHNVLTRLAGLEMQRSEQQQLDAKELKRHFDQAIALYRELLENKPDNNSNDLLLYQVAKAHELDGDIEKSQAVLNRLITRYPSSEHYSEAQFRRAEILFSKRKYRDAESAYTEVLRTGQATPFYDNALYMLGWSRFKQGRYNASIKPYTQILDALLITDDQVNTEQALDSLLRSKRGLVNDTLRVMSLAFSYMEGPHSIESAYISLGSRPYEHLLYHNLGQLYLDKERYRDSAETYQTFVDLYPQSRHAPQFSVNIIEAYIAGQFPKLVLPAKAQFVTHYGIRSEFWAASDENVRDDIHQHLHKFIMELAKYEHSKAQQLENAKALKGEPEKEKIRQQEVINTYRLAAGWYRQFIDTFPDDKTTPDAVFLMADSLYDAGDLAQAINAYQQVASHYQHPDKGADAGYAALATLDELKRRSPTKQQEHLLRRKVDSAQDFTRHYPNDKRAAKVLTRTAEELFLLKDYPNAIAVAERVTTWTPTPGHSLLYTSSLVAGHSQFELQDFMAAEHHYRAALRYQQKLKDKSDQPNLLELIAASIYKQGEKLLVAEEKQLAVDAFLRVQSVLPDSEIAIKSQYDAAAYLIELGSWQAAEDVLLQFKTSYPTHALTADITPKLVNIYQQMENWPKAADQIMLLFAQEKDPQAKGDTLLLAAETYEKASDFDTAIKRYRDYYYYKPHKFDLATEAQFKLAELYRKVGNEKNRRFWLKKLVGNHKNADKTTERSNYLAAYATREFAAEDFTKFEALKLRLPLERSMKKKLAALNKALGSYQNLISYNHADFTTEANFHIGQLYTQLSSDLMNSQRPKLDVLELEQYEILLEEQAYPFEEQAIEMHHRNTGLTLDGIYDQWVKRSFASLGKLLPARYNKQEQRVSYSNDIY